MKRVKKQILCIVLVFLFLCQSTVVYASGVGNHGGGGGTHEEGGTSYEGNYTLKAFWQLGRDSSEKAAFGLTELSKVILFGLSSLYGTFTGTGYKGLAEGFVTYSDNFWTGEWIHVDANNNVTYDQELIDLLKQFLTEYAQQHPEEVEKINYRIIHTLSYEEAFKNYIDYSNVLEGNITVPEGSNSMEYWEKMWNTQTQYDSFPRMIMLPTYYMKYSPENVQNITIIQTFSFFEGYEQGKNICLIGGFGGNGWGDSSQYQIGVYTYDVASGALSIDSKVYGVQQHCRFIWDENEAVWNGTQMYSDIFGGKWNAYINMSASYWGGGWGYYAQNIDSEYGKRYAAVYNDDKSVTIPVLATPSSTAFRLFATEQDAMRYFEICTDCDLNFDPSQVYTGGSVTINNNGDVTINNTPSDVGNDTPIVGSEMLEMIYNRLGEILTKVSQIKQISVADTVINAIDTLESRITGITDRLIDTISQVFPFCILWDFVRIVKIFEAEPILPVFEIPIKFVWIDETITIDLTEYETLFTLLRTGEIILFLFGLFNITMTWVGKGDEII